MKIRNYVIGYHITLFVLLMVLFSRMNEMEYRAVDISALNRNVKTIEEYLARQDTWNEEDPQIKHLGQQYDCRILRTDDDHYMEGMYEAYNNGDTMFDYMQGDHLIAKIIFFRTDDSFQKMKRQVLQIIIGIICGTALLGDLLLIILYIRLVRPFSKLKTFASNIATGDLDAPLMMERHNYFGAFTESFDVMREELKTAREGEAKANKSKKELVASLSHDIKTPVATIKALCEILEIKLKDEEHVDKIQTIARKADLIDQLISNMFHATLTELEALKINPKPEPSTELMEMCREMNHYDLIHFQNEVPSCLVYYDKLRMNQVLDNIIGNSYKYAHTRIDISFWENNENLFMKIKDYGKELDDLEFALICEKFYRGANVEGKSGSGLGLFLAKQFMEGMQGSILCENEQGFAVTLSLKKFGKSEDDLRIG